MAKYIIGADLTGTPDGYNGYFTSISAAVAGMSNGDTADVMDGTYAYTTISKSIQFNALGLNCIVADNSAVIPVTFTLPGDSTITGFTILGRDDLLTTRLVSFESNITLGTKKLVNCTIGPIKSGVGLRPISGPSASVEMLGGSITSISASRCVNASGPCKLSNVIVNSSGTITYVLYFTSPNSAITIENCDITLINNSSVPIYVTNTTGPTTVSITRNRISYKYDEYGILIGSETTTAYDGACNGAVITDNILYGSLYHNPSLTNPQSHAIMVGHNINPTIKRNIVRGAEYGCVYKGTNQTDVSGAIRYNVFLNCSYGYRVKGIANAKITHSTIYSTLGPTVQDYGIALSNNDGVGSGTITEFKNNIIYMYSNYLMNIGTGGTLTNCDYNAYISRQNPTLSTSFYHGGSGKTWAQWVALGYDSNSFFIHDKADGTYDVYKGSAPLVIDRTLSFCPVKSDGKLEERSDNPLIDAGVFISGVNDTGETDPWGGYVYRLPNIGADQLTGMPYRAYNLTSSIIQSIVG